MSIGPRDVLVIESLLIGLNYVVQRLKFQKMVDIGGESSYH